MANLIELLRSGDKDQIRIQYDEENDQLYVNNKKVAYEVAFTKWQKILAVGVSIAIILEALSTVFGFFFRDFEGLMKLLGY